MIHLMVSGDYLPVRWLRSLWVKIHAAKQLNIQLIKGGDKVAGYILGQYIGKQNKFIRMYVSRGWLFPGARASFLELIRRRKAELGDTLGYKTALDDWNAYLLAHRPATSVLAAEDRDASMKAHRKDHHARLSGHFRAPRAAVGVDFDEKPIYSHAKRLLLQRARGCVAAEETLSPLLADLLAEAEEQEQYRREIVALRARRARL